MIDILRDSAFGRLVRSVTRDKFFSYDEERDSSTWKKFLDRGMTNNMAHCGQLHPADVKVSAPASDQSTPAIEKTNPLSIDQSGRPELSNEAEKDDAASKILHSTLTNVPVASTGGRDLTIVNWSGPDDPDNPMNWSRGKKFFVTFEICLLTFSVYIGSAIYSAGIPSVVEEFGVSPVAALLGLCLYVAGYGLGPLVWASMSEIYIIGRNPVYIGTLFVFVVLQVPTALASNFGMLLAFRFLTGVFGSPALATGGASISDMYRPQKRAYGIGIWGISAVCGPVLGPLVGAFAATAKGWRWTIWELMWLSGFTLLLLFFFLPETSSGNILYRRTLRLRKLTGIDSLRCEPEIEAESMTGKDIALMVLVRPITLTLTEPIVLALNLYISLLYSLIYIWFESFPVVFIGIYNFTQNQQGLAFLGILIGGFITIPPFFWYLHRYTEPQFDPVTGTLQPEKRLPPAFVGAFCIPICLFWFGWSARADVHWIMPVIGSAWFTIGAYLLFNAVLNYLGDAYPEYAASVYAGNDFMRSAFAAGFPLFSTGMYHKLGVGWASSLLGFLSIAFIPIPFILYKYGRQLRLKSRHARHDI